MWKIALMLTACAGSAAQGISQESAGGVQPGLGAQVDAYLQRLEGVGFSGSVLVAKDGEVILEQGYGFANREARVPATPDHVYTIGSVSKQFTAAAILKLEMQGKLRVEDPIRKHLEGVPEDKAGITIHHLLTHTAGFVGGLGGDFDLEATRDRLLQDAMRSELMFEPGERHEYSNLGYSLLGMIVETASGQPYETYLREHLFLPAGMRDTGYLLPKYESARLAVGYLDGEAWGSVIEQPMLEDGPSWNLRANGGIHSTVGDLYRWHQALESDRILSKEARRKMFTPHVDEGMGISHYGYGWAIFTTSRGTRLIAHNGGNMVFQADFRRYVDEDVMFCITKNTSKFDIDYVSHQIASALFGHEYDLPPETLDIGQADLERFEGDYQLEDGSAVSIEAGYRHLRLSADRGRAVALLLGGSSETGAELESLQQRTLQVVEAAGNGDYQPLYEAFGGEIPLEALSRQEAAMRERFAARYGPHVGVEPVAVVGDLGRATVFLKFVHEQQSLIVRYGWEMGQIVGIRTSRGLPPTELYPISTQGFQSFRIEDPESRLTAEFEIDRRDRSIRALVLVTPTGRVRVVRED